VAPALGVRDPIRLRLGEVLVERLVQLAAQRLQVRPPSGRHRFVTGIAIQTVLP
jgi:hypothetical protein